MLFTSYEFIAFFLVLLLLYYVVPKKCQWMLLLIANCIFYCSASPKHLIYILCTTLLTYVTALRIARSLSRQKQYLHEHKDEMDKAGRKEYKQKCQKRRKLWLAGCLIAVLGLLAVLKYTNFFIANLNSVLAGFGTQLNFVTLAIPLGISFYTLQAVGYLVDVYRGTVEAEKNFFRYFLFVSFFPLLIQGPISRYGDLSKTLYEPHAANKTEIFRGLQRMLWGYFKKLVIADRILIGLRVVLDAPDTYQGAYVVVGMLLYTVELYADFTGGIDITIGLSQALGIHVMENFRLPYFSKSLKEYWRRWHISMCSWFRDYVFYPASVSAVMQKMMKWGKTHLGNRAGKRLPVYAASFLVWMATGIWHGASWNYVIWGLLNWAVLMASEEMEPLYARFHRRFSCGEKQWYKLWMIVRTFCLICILNLFDCYGSAGTTLYLLGSVFRAKNWNIFVDGSLLRLGMSAVDFCVLAAGVALMLVVSLLQLRGSVREQIGKLAYPVRVCLWFGLFVSVLLLGAYGHGYDASQFIYNQF